jgi:hypothetical protein
MELAVKLILRVLVAVLALLVIGGTIKGLVHDTPKREKIVRVGGRVLTIPTDTPKNVFAVTRAAMKQMGYLPWYQDCIIGQAERLLTPAEARRLMRAPKSKRNDAELTLILKAGPHCEEPGRATVNPNATPRQLSIIRFQSAETVRLLFAKEKLSSRFQTCASRQIRHATDAETLELANGSPAVQEAALLRLLKPCA